MKLSVNGVRRTIEAAADTPLLWVLRDELGLSGTKFSCGIGQCGACTVHLDGRAVPSCVTRVSAAVGREVTTIEGLEGGGEHPVQRAWEELSVPQCGYCQVGQIMSAVALLAEHPVPTDDQITAGMEGNLCRCGTYLRIRAAIHRAAQGTP